MHNQLVKIGLDQKAAAVYVACLKHGKVTPTKLAAVTGVKRTSLYPILTMLTEKGLLFSKTFSKRKHYCPYPPHRAMEAVTAEATLQADQVAQSAKQLTKQLESISKRTHVDITSGAALFTGPSGIRELVQKILDQQQDIYWIGSSNIFLQLPQEQQREMFQKLSVKRMDAGTTAYAISDRNFTTSTYFHGGSPRFRQLQVVELPADLRSMIMVTGDLCGFIKLEGSSLKAAMLEDADYATICECTLKLLWDVLAKSKTANFPDLVKN